MVAVTYLFLVGVGIWGIEIPVAWGFAIINFVWWIGIGHAGTLISAILLLLKQTWRNSINRFAEAMTLFAVACAGMFPLLHMGRPWLAYWMFPYPSSMGVWPQFRSPLVWDVFAVSTYATISAVFWYVGLVPDFATMREKATHPIDQEDLRHCWPWAGAVRRGIGSVTRRCIFCWPALRRRWCCRCTRWSASISRSPSFPAGTPPSSRLTSLPAQFIPASPWCWCWRFRSASSTTWNRMITMRHLQNSAKIMLATGLIVAYGYFFEAFIAFYSGSTYERFMMQNRWFGQYAVFYWSLILCNILIPQILWFPKIRANIRWLF